MTMMYDRQDIQREVDRLEKKERGDSPDEYNIRLSENLSFIFRMFLISLMFIAFVMLVSE